MSNKMLRASLLIALLALVASLSYQHSSAFAATAHNCLSGSQTAEACTSHPSSAISIKAVKPTLARTIARSKTSGDRITGSDGLAIPPLQWQSSLERPTALLHIDRDRAGHAGRAPPAP